VSEFEGYHAEWNLGCPGGWEYQRMAQVRGELCWRKIKRAADIDLDLSFDHPLLNPVPALLDLLLRVHKDTSPDEDPFVLLVAEAETLDQVTENMNLVAYLNRMDGITAALTSPQALEVRGGDITYRGKKATVIFQDMNNDTLLKIGEMHPIEPMLTAVRKGIVVNPRGMEPVGAKGVFEAVTGDVGATLSGSTVSRTPWTRLFHPRTTTGPRGEPIPDLVEWTHRHWEEIILKPVYGYSGRGIFVGAQRASREEDIQEALAGEPYIVQSLVPRFLWAERYPWVDASKGEVELRRWQTDFRCLISDRGLIGFLARFGGIPTNVGAGGGNQSIALLKAEISVKEAVNRVNDAIMGLGFDTVMEIQQEADRKGMELGHTYLNGPTPTTLRPRIITARQLTELRDYSTCLWHDLLKLEALWRAGELDHVVQMSPPEAVLARAQPWRGSPALVASDGLFSFGAHIED
jgi:hypothetical protein